MGPLEPAKHRSRDQRAGRDGHAGDHGIPLHINSEVCHDSRLLSIDGLAQLRRKICNNLCDSLVPRCRQDGHEPSDGHPQQLARRCRLQHAEGRPLEPQRELADVSAYRDLVDLHGGAAPEDGDRAGAHDVVLEGAADDDVHEAGTHVGLEHLLPGRDCDVGDRSRAEVRHECLVHLAAGQKDVVAVKIVRVDIVMQLCSQGG
mmetsp:Transcript_4332/g.10444  ORF Transcript_4332/g.10444 Transcript_4332/m.10444 type:complete len:203 (+) Transcript_4332:372-980(+)